MRKILVIAQNTFKETIRDRILYGILAFALLFIFSITLLGSLSLGEDAKIIENFGLAGIYIFSLIITIFLGASLIYKEIEKRTIYLILSKPVSTWQIVAGKFLGLMASVILTTALMTLVFFGVVILKTGAFNYLSLMAIFMQIFEMAIFVAMLIVFSTFSTPLASTIYTVIILYVGHLLNLLLKLAHRSGIFLKFLITGAYYIFPNLEKFNLRDLVIHNTRVSGGEIITAITYSIFYSALLLYLASLLLKTEEL